MFWIENVLKMLAMLFFVALLGQLFTYQMWVLLPPERSNTRLVQIVDRVLFFVQPICSAALVGVFIFASYYTAAGSLVNGDTNTGIFAGVLLGFSIFAWFLLLWHPFAKLMSGLGNLVFARIRPLAPKKS